MSTEITFSDELDLAIERKLKQETGNIIQQVPRMVQALMEHPVTREPLYLCSWQQDFIDVYY